MRLLVLLFIVIGIMGSSAMAASPMTGRCSISNDIDDGGPMWRLMWHNGKKWKKIGDYTSGTEAFNVLVARETSGKCSRGSRNSNLMYKHNACPACPDENCPKGVPSSKNCQWGAE